MKILLVNKFLYPKGGDAISTLQTGDLLSAHGHQVAYWGMAHPENPSYQTEQHFISRVEYDGELSFSNQFKAAGRLLYSLEAKRNLQKLLCEFRPDIVHLNNFAHQISPSILHVLKNRGIPVVMTMHDYKMVCASYSMLAMGQPCERCRGGAYYWCAITRCNKGSLTKSLLSTAEMYLHHSLLGIYDTIQTYIAPSKFLADKVVQMGFTGRVVYLQNFVNLRDWEPTYSGERQRVLYVGRLSEEKGIRTLLTALKGTDVQLHIVGDGPLGEEIRNKLIVEAITNVTLVGYAEGQKLRQEINDAAVVIVPSICYENNPRIVIEAFASGKAVIGARIGGIPELVQDGVTGRTFEPGNAQDLRDSVLSMLANPQEIVEMGKRGRKRVEQEFGPELHYDRLITIYMEAMRR